MKPIEEKLRGGMPPFVRQILERLNEAGFESYVVGGCVRDALLGRQPHDCDVCTSALPQEVMDCFSDYTVHPTGIQHGTVLVVREGEGVEVTTFRTENGYSDHRHPDKVTFVRSVEEDLSRRDFTVNAMAYHPSRGIVDPFGGQQDLREQVIRCVGVPEQRFREDGLRIFRALRFAARYGFSIEAETARAMHECRELLDYIAVERIFQELKGFLSGRAVRALMLEHREIFAVFLPELRPTFDFDQRNPNHCYDVWEHTVCAVDNAAPNPVVRLAMLFHDVGKPACFTVDEAGVGHFKGHDAVSAEIAERVLTRLRCDGETLRTVVNLVRLHDKSRRFTWKGSRRLLSQLGPDQTKLLLQVMEADIKAQAPATVAGKMELLLDGCAKVDALLAANACFTKGDMELKGGDLLALGLRPGILVGHVLEQVFQQVLDGTLENRKDILLNRARALIAEENS